jgi:hypothetical protein
MSKTIILIFTLFFTNLAFATQKTIKFDKPETDAERALDGILTMGGGLKLNSWIKCTKCNNDDRHLSYERTTTKAFRADEDNQQKEY